MQEDQTENSNQVNLESVIQGICEREGCQFYDFEWDKSQRDRILRVFIEKNVDDGVSLTDCENVSKGLSLALDVEDLVGDTPYSLEVSSPGAERVLTKAWHFESVVGKKIKATLNRSLGVILPDDQKVQEVWSARKKLVGIVVASEENTFLIEMDGIKVPVPYNEVDKAKVVFEMQLSAESINKKNNDNKKSKTKR